MRNRHHRPHAAKVAERREEGDVGLEQAKGAHGLRHGGCARSRTDLAHQRAEMLHGRGGERFQQRGGVALDQAREKRGGAEDAAEQIADLGLAQQRQQRGEAGLIAATAFEIGKDGGRAVAIVRDGRAGDELMKRFQLRTCRMSDLAKVRTLRCVTRSAQGLATEARERPHPCGSPFRRERSLAAVVGAPQEAR